MIGIVDYGMGNLLSVYSAFDYLDEKVKICKNPEDLQLADRIVIPGVGAFQDCIRKLQSSGFAEALNIHCINQAKPTLGICLGMQVMANNSTEGGETIGLGWFDASVIKLHPNDKSLRIPNIGWNEVNYKKDVVLFNRLPANPDFYLVHSYYMKCNNTENIVATYEYGQTVTAAILKDNIFATQFHPEKSQDYGLVILENFLKWNP
ncbi:MAG: imidazole glycerol phosphate synthase subunit HisH [Bacteroidia bacterium]